MLNKRAFALVLTILMSALAACTLHPVSEDGDEAGLAFAAALSKLTKYHVLPGGIDCGFNPSACMEQNKFAIFDVDNDGKEELIILYRTAECAAGMTGGVFAYDAGSSELRPELLEFPALTFYDNGIIKALWSHNQGRGGNFWPYNLYKYDGDSDTYELVGMVDAWDKSLEAGIEGDPFPDNIDESGTGFVYYIHSVAQDEGFKDVDPVDASVYKEWLNVHLGDATEIKVKYLDLSEQNIRK